MSRRSLGVALAAIALGAMTTVPAQAEPAGNTIIEIKNVYYGTCLQSAVVSGLGGTDLAPCDGSSAQRWERAVGGGLGTNVSHVLRNAGTGNCATGWSSPYQYYCDVEDGEQNIRFEPAGDGTVKLRFVHQTYGTHYVTGMSSNHVSNTGPSDDPAQRWEVREVGRPTPPGDTAGQVIRLNSHYRNQCAAADDQAAVVLQVCDASAGQRFRRVELSDGSFQLRNEEKGKCLVANSGNASATGSCDPADEAQKWRFDTDSLGLLSLRSTRGGLLTATVEPGTNTYLSAPWTRNRYTQKWEVSVA
jgi:hypothetical protein